MAEVNDQPIAEIFCNMAAEARDRLGRGPLRPRSDIAPFLRIETSRNFGLSLTRSHNKNRQMAPPRRRWLRQASLQQHRERAEPPRCS